MAGIIQAPRTNGSLYQQIGGDHYKTGQIQPVVYIHANQLNFLEGCIVKRITRWRKKSLNKADQVHDLLKIKHEVDLLIELEGLVDAEMANEASS